MTNRVCTTRKDFLVMHNLLETKLSKIEGTEYWKYVPGASDATVAEEAAVIIGKPVNKEHIKHVRMESFGKIRVPAQGQPAKKYANNPNIENRLARIETVLKVLIDALGFDEGKAVMSQQSNGMYRDH